MNPGELARRLRDARLAMGLSQRAVAAEIGLSRPAVTQIEAGRRSVSTPELARMSDLYRRPVSDFLRGDSSDEDALVVLQRMVPRLKKRQTSLEELARFFRLCRAGVQLGRLLGVDRGPGLPSYEMSAPTTDAEAIRQGENVAMRERRRLGVGNVPVGDIRALIASQGVWTSNIELPDTIAGLYLQRQDTGSVVITNAFLPRDRTRFFLIRGYGQILLDRGQTVGVFEVHNSRNLKGLRASAFATAFLMPANDVYEALQRFDKGHPSRREYASFDAANCRPLMIEVRSSKGTYRITYIDVALIAREFRVSYEAALWRLSDLRYLTQPEVQILRRQESTGQAYLEIFDPSSDVGKLEQYRDRDSIHRRAISRLVIEAYRRGEISRGRVLDLSKMLEIEGDTLFRMAQETCIK